MDSEFANKNHFEKLLRSFVISEKNQQILRDTELVLLVGPSAAGKNTILDNLTHNHDFHQIVSTTTRQPRENHGRLEQNGKEYWFITEEEMMDKISRGEMLEANIIHDHYVSGISISELESASLQGKTPINEIEIGGVDSVLKIKSNAKVFFILPPSYQQWHKRLHKRGIPDPIVLKKRFKSAVKEYQHLLDNPFYYPIVNHDVETSVQEIIEAIKSGNRQNIDNELVENLIQKSHEQIAKLEQ